MASIEIEPHDLTEMTYRFALAGNGSYTFLAVETDGRVGGYAYAGSYRKS